MMFILAPPHLVELDQVDTRYRYDSEPLLWIAVGEWIALATQRAGVLHLVDLVPVTWSRDTRARIHPRGEPPDLSAVAVARLA
jgi:hypothetical protein